MDLFRTLETRQGKRETEMSSYEELEKLAESEQKLKQKMRPHTERITSSLFYGNRKLSLIKEQF